VNHKHTQNKMRVMILCLLKPACCWFSYAKQASTTKLGAVALNLKKPAE